jgi:hypothetical protein
MRAVQPYPFRKSALRVLRDRSLANAAFVAWYASPFRIILVIDRGAEITSPAALGSAVHKERHPRVGKRLSLAAGTNAKPVVSSGAAGATLGSKRRGRSRSNLSDYALDNRPSTGGEWATGCFPNASSAHWFLRLVDRKKPRLSRGFEQGLPVGETPPVTGSGGSGRLHNARVHARADGDT